MTDAWFSHGWSSVAVRPNGDEILCRAAITDPKEATGRVLEVAGEGIAARLGA
ncbi:MAG: hypothetical protein U1E21_21590 [Reyranellaceae bacterium]